MKKVISIVLNNFKNDSRVLKENISLQKAGYDVQVLALHEEPLEEKEIIQNIPVHRIKLKTRKWSKNKLIQVIKYIEFIFKIIRDYKDADIYHCNDLNALPIGVIIKKFFNKKAKIVYDAHEYETERAGLYGIEKKIHKIIEKLLIKYADKVITVSNSIAEEYVKLYNIKKPSLILNCPYYFNEERTDIFRKKFNISQDSIIFLYQGGLTEGRGIDNILDAFAKIEGKNKIVVFMGYGELENKIKRYADKYKNIFFQQAVPITEVLNYSSSADMGLVLIENSCISYKYCMPNKVFEALMSGLPIIAFEDLYEVNKLIMEYRVGIIIKNMKDIANKISNIKVEELLEYKKNIDIIRRIYNWENQEKTLLKLYEDLI